MSEPKITDESKFPHPEYERLLASRDAHDAEVAAHVAGCAACARRLAEASALRGELRALPLLAPPSRGWRQLRDRIPARAPASGLPRRAGLAAAALIAVLAYRTIRHPVTIPTPVKTTAAAHEDLTALIARSRALEAALAAQPEPHALSGADAEMIFRYEDGLGAVDRKLARLPAGDPAAAKLWQRRGELLGGLLDARAPRTADPDLARL